MICCCSLAGTEACKTCYNKFDYPSNTIPESAKISTSKVFTEYIQAPQKEKTSKPKIQYWCNECDALLNKFANYCHNCGVKLDWSEIDNKA